MRTRTLTLPVAAAFSLALLASPAAASSRHHARIDVDSDAGTGDVTISGSEHVDKNEVRDSDVVAIFGDARIEGKVNGDVVVILGSLDLSGSVGGDVVSVMSHTKVADTASIAGDMVTVGWPPEGLIRREQVRGQIVDISFMRFVPFTGKGGLSGLLRLWFMVKLMRLAGLFLILLLVTALVPRRLETISAAFPRKWGYAILAGLLTYAGIAIGCVLLGITIIGIPLAAALYCALMITKWLGLASILFLMGQTIGRNVFSRDLPHVASVLGGFAVYALLFLIPFFGFVFWFVASVLAVGIAVLTRFGSEEPWRRGAAAAGSPPPAPDVPPPGGTPPRI